MAKTKGVLRETVETFLIALLIALVIRTFFVQVFFIPSGSMIPTLEVSDRILVNKLAFGLTNPLNELRTNDKFFLVPNPLYDVPLPFSDIKYVVAFHPPQRGDIVVFKYPSDDPELRKRDFIKRVIGLPGETLQVTNGFVSINGKVLDEHHLMDRDAAFFGPVQVPPHHYFVMGDNRGNSSDSRVWGFLPEQNIVGRAFCKIWPIGRVGLLQ